MDILCNNINCNGIGMRRADWDNFRECQDIVLNGQVIWEGIPLSLAVKSQIYEDIVTTGHHSASLAAEVWRAANLYCKAHQQAHPELTAQGKLLSAFVNADVNMYCSLPLTLTPAAQSAMPTRYVVGSASSYFDTLFKPTSGVPFEITYHSQFVKYSERQIEGWNSLQWWGINGNGSSFGKNGSGASFNTTDIYEVKISYSGSGNVYLTLNGASAGYTGFVANNFHAFHINGWNNECMRDKRKDVIIMQNGNLLRNFIPAKISNLMELLDLETLTLATRVGTFTEQKDIPNS